MVNQELALYDARLEQKPQLVVLNKMDLPEAASWEPLVRERVTEAGSAFAAISAVTGEGVTGMLYQVKRMLDEVVVPMATTGDVALIRPETEEGHFSVTQEKGGFRVSGRRIERIAAMTYWEFEATSRRFQQILESMGITEALLEAGVSTGDTVYIGDEVLEWAE